MELDEAIKKRRSIRKYAEREIPEKTLYDIINAGMMAPTASNRRGWRFIIITEPAVKQALVDEGAAAFIKNAPASILVLYSKLTDNVEWLDHVVSASLAIQNMALYAHEHGVGSCIVCHLPTKEQVKKLLRIQNDYIPIALITLGYPAETRDEPRHEKIEEKISYETYNFDDFPQVTEAVKTATRRELRKTYYKLPGRRHIKPVIDKIFEKKFPPKK
jgi:nitroreductase